MNDMGRSAVLLPFLDSKEGLNMAETTSAGSTGTKGKGKKRNDRYTGNYPAPSEGGMPAQQMPAMPPQQGSTEGSQQGSTDSGNKYLGSWTNKGGDGWRQNQSGGNVAITNDLMGQAELYYQAAYEAQRLAAQQTHDESQLLLDQQLAGLAKTYDQQREQSRQNYDQAYSQADRQALSRGMQRSSYTGATLANIDLAGNEAQQAISDTQAQQESNLNEQKTLYGRQLQQSLESLTKQQQADVLAKVDELKKRQEELQLQQQELQMQKDQMDMDYYMWEQEFNAKYNKSGGGSSSSKTKSSGGGKPSSDGDKDDDNGASDLLGALGVSNPANAAKWAAVTEYDKRIEAASKKNNRVPMTK